ncbi:glycoside hydrolase family 2 TIM barrel-domain containing protein [Bifidobacterium sp. ESL0764]|uniref:glycoside hydrolase family 2 TIM barrel-domain containing protein n=1 Tax=Bifidobacterium sp. ESL0764 TaxID=2983228 RepID=UPI0023F800CC|nr:glycoside hydrolase family 2 TIM barrel-domain containing protein [Bifidobacterium sp. ESL0764]WEV65857.1 DUF4982 domain-containing protein [Bifidobacterium sp. ESL0764]
MQPTGLNRHWQVRHLSSDEAFTPVTLPHDAMLYEPRFEDAPGGTNTGWFDGRDYEYVRHFKPGEALRGKAMILEFEGVYRLAEVFVNGRKAGSCDYGYSGFTVDVTDLVTIGEDNEIRVVARNADQPNSRWYSGAGIYRPVTLWTGPREHIRFEGVGVRTISAAPAKVEITLQTTGTGKAHIEIFEGERNTSISMGTTPSVSASMSAASLVPLPVSATSITPASARIAPITSALPTAAASADCETDEQGNATVAIDIPDAKLWSPEHPDLYTCQVTYEAENGQFAAADDTGNTNDTGTTTDTASTVFGIRTLDWGDNGFLINGERTIMQGACVHHTNGILGAAAFDDAERRKVQGLKAQGYNAIRSAHNPCSKALLKACDELGMLVLDEYIDHWYIHKTLYDYVDYFEANRQDDLKAMVRKDHNHPSVVMYSIGNEVSETAEKKGIALTRSMVGLLHGLDPTRPVTCGVNIFFNFLSSIGFGVYSDKKARKEVESQSAEHVSASHGESVVPGACVAPRATDGSAKSKHKAVGSEFFNNLAGIMGADFMKTGATLHACDVKTRDAFAQLDIAGYNYGIKRYRKDLRRYPHRLILGSETFCADAYRFKTMAKDNPRLIGDFVWAGMDYMGETGVGAWEYGDDAPAENGFGWLTSGSGRLDLTGRVTGEALYTRVALEESHGPYLAVRPVNHTGDKHSPSAWKMTDAVPSWSWEGYEGHKADVEVYARAASVVLILNGKEIARKTLQHDCLARFGCTYQPGTLEAVSFDESGAEIGRCAVTSAEGPTKLTASMEPVDGFEESQYSSSDTPKRRDGNASSTCSPGHLAYVRVRYTDAAGITKPLQHGTLSATVSGGRLVAFGSAAPYNPGSFVTGSTGTYRGEALAIIEMPDSQAGRQSGGKPVATLNVTDGKLETSFTIKAE